MVKDKNHTGVLGFNSEHSEYDSKSVIYYCKAGGGGKKRNRLEM